jgi:serine/threonine protein kinase
MGENAGESIVGQHIGPYQVLGLIGVGGMGEVYRAHDTKLGRDVAIKILPKELASAATFSSGHHAPLLHEAI